MQGTARAGRQGDRIDLQFCDADVYPTVRAGYRKKREEENVKEKTIKKDEKKKPQKTLKEKRKAKKEKKQQ